MEWFEKISGLLLPLEGGIIAGLFLAVFLTSLSEKEYRAAWISLPAGLLLSLPCLLPVVAYARFPVWISMTFSMFMAISVLMLFLPFRGRIRYRFQNPDRRYDERDTLFSRQDLVPGTGRYEEYYARRPENKAADNRFRRKPGLLKAGTSYYDPILFAAAASIFEKVVDELHPRVEGEPAKVRIEFDETGHQVPGAGESQQNRAGEVHGPAKSNPGEISRLLLEMAVDWGAHSAGITELRDHHVYSVGGRGERYGVDFGVDHTYALALTVEMDYDMMRMAPAAPTVLESARQYLQSGLIAVQLAEFIRSLGFPARAHIDGNYQVVCPLVARDAGLGEIGRMGLLMTPRLGPRCRIAVVTTDIPLVPGTLEKRGSGATVIDFCRRCEKCASACPARAIPGGPETEGGGVKRWQIDAVSCFTYWCQAGTDCGRCMIVCPYSHPDNWFHNLVRSGVRNNWIFRRLALPFDHLFYGRIPRSRHRI